MPFKEYVYSGPRGNNERKRTFEAFAETIDKFQNVATFHPLTCGVNSQHENLVPRMTTSGICVLVCPTCGYVQDYIPEFIFKDK